MNWQQTLKTAKDMARNVKSAVMIGLNGDQYEIVAFWTDEYAKEFGVAIVYSDGKVTILK